MSDSIFNYGDDKIGTFYSVEKTDYDINLDVSSQLLNINFFIDQSEDFYQRKVYNFFDLTGQIGGLYEILSIIGGIFVAFFADKILMLSLMSKLYQVEDEKQEADPPVFTQNFRTSRVSPVDHMFEEEKTPQTLHKKPNLEESWPDEQDRGHDVKSKKSNRRSMFN